MQKHEGGKRKAGFMELKLRGGQGGGGGSSSARPERGKPTHGRKKVDRWGGHPHHGGSPGEKIAPMTEVHTGGVYALSRQSERYEVL